MEKYIYELKMKVRDYECDLQGIVNNANYQHYLEHTRHEFLTSVGISFARLHEEGIDPVVARLTMAFKTPLKSGDEFVSKLYMKKEGIKYVFYQDIFRLPAPIRRCVSGPGCRFVRLASVFQIRCENFIKQSAYSQSSVHDADRFHAGLDHHLHVRQAEDVLIEHILDAFLLHVQLRYELVSAP